MTYAKAKKYKILGLIFLYFAIAGVLLNLEFHTSQQTKTISSFKLLHRQVDPHGRSNDRQIILIIIDSAKYGYWSEIPAIQSRVKQQESRSYLFRTIVSQPTMTTQKIQTLMTGSEIFSSTSIIDAFFSSSVSIDNVVQQVGRRGGRAVAMGDDTWGKLFNFEVEYPCVNTFDIWDWDGCDEIIYKNLMEEVKNDNEITVAHFLALDHIGHSTSSVSSPQFRPRKQKISQFLDRIIENMNDRQVLFVTGDHGMRNDGNHGGNSLQQTQSFAFVHSKIPQLLPTIDKTQQFRSQNMPQVPQVRQSDITATLSLLLGIPVPSNSIGIPFLMLKQDLQHMDSIISQLRTHFNQILSLNKIQCETEPMNSFVSFRNLQSQCLVSLSHQSPSLPILIALIFSLCIVTLTFSVSLALPLLQYALVLLISLPHTFSWYLIRHSSTYYLIANALLCCVVSCRQRGALFKGLAVLVVLAQMESVKPGDYVGNLVRVEGLAEVLVGEGVRLGVMVGWLCWWGRGWAGEVRKLRVEGRWDGVKWGWVLVRACYVLLLTIGLLQALDLPHPKILLNYLTTCLSLCSLLSPHSSPIPILPLLFTPKSTLLPVLLLLLADTPSTPLSTYLHAHWLWWLMGNRYEYSSIDIRWSYVYGLRYHWLVNSVGLLVGMMVPYWVAVAVRVRREGREEKQGREGMKRVGDGEAESESVLAEVQEQQRQEQQKVGDTSLLRVLLLPMVWMICCFINLIFNHEKILYTVVYVPMTIIQFVKNALLVIIVLAYYIFN